jgi:hypothetical protein
MTSPVPLSDPLIAPRWHTALLVGLYLSVALLGSLMPAQGAAASALPVGGRIVARYLPLLLVQWVIVFYVVRVGRARSALRGLLGIGWTGPHRVVVDLALALGAVVAIACVERAWALGAAGGSAPSVAHLRPSTPWEVAAWIVVAASVGFCEEVVFRGYLLKQFEAFTGSAALAVVVQAVLFGVAHGEQGATAAARVACYGLGLGALARWRRSLAPGIAAHIVIDLVSGLAKGG